jgi:hypothetical protein
MSNPEKYEAVSGIIFLTGIPLERVYRLVSQSHARGLQKDHNGRVHTAPDLQMIGDSPQTAATLLQVAAARPRSPPKSPVIPLLALSI